MSKLRFLVTIDYTHEEEDGVIDPVAMEANLEAVIEHGRQDGRLTPDDISANSAWALITPWRLDDDE